MLALISSDKSDIKCEEKGNHNYLSKILKQILII